MPKEEDEIYELTPEQSKVREKSKNWLRAWFIFMNSTWLGFLLAFLFYSPAFVVDPTSLSYDLTLISPLFTTTSIVFALLVFTVRWKSYLLVHHKLFMMLFVMIQFTGMFIFGSVGLTLKDIPLQTRNSFFVGSAFMAVGVYATATFLTLCTFWYQRDKFWRSGIRVKQETAQ